MKPQLYLLIVLLLTLSSCIEKKNDNIAPSSTINNSQPVSSRTNNTSTATTQKSGTSQTFKSINGDVNEFKKLVLSKGILTAQDFSNIMSKKAEFTAMKNQDSTNPEWVEKVSNWEKSGIAEIVGMKKFLHYNSAQAWWNENYAASSAISKGNSGSTAIKGDINEFKKLVLSKGILSKQELNSILAKKQEFVALRNKDLSNPEWLTKVKHWEKSTIAGLVGQKKFLHYNSSEAWWNQNN